MTDTSYIEKSSNRMMASRHTRIAREFEDDIAKMEEIQLRGILNCINTMHLAGQIAIFKDEADRQWLKVKSYKKGEL